MFFYEGQQCPVCHQYFAEGEDIVTCPECGAPHHRSCWRQEGHCHFADRHGTAEQWGSQPIQEEKAATPTRRCPNCGRENPEFAEFCAGCGRELPAVNDNAASPPPAGQYTPPPYGDHTAFRMPTPDPYGGVSRTEQIDGVSVDELAELIGNNSSYYLPRFLEMDRTGRKISWNWASFLFSYNWLLYRKNWLFGIVLFVFSTALEFLSRLSFKGVQVDTYTQMYAAVEQLMTTQSGQMMLTVAMIASLLSLTVQILCGLFGNWLYMQDVLKRAHALQEDPDARYHLNFFTRGGTSFAAAIAPNLLIAFVSNLLLLLSISL